MRLPTPRQEPTSFSAEGLHAVLSGGETDANEPDHGQFGEGVLCYDCNHAEALGAYMTTKRHPTETLPTGLLALRNPNEALGPIVLIELAGVEVEALRFITEAR